MPFVGMPAACPRSPSGRNHDAPDAHVTPGSIEPDASRKTRREGRKVRQPCPLAESIIRIGHDPVTSSPARPPACGRRERCPALFFPAGGPAIGDVYARHPLRRRDYLPYADHHRLVLQEKSIEAARYLLSLGAQDVRIAWPQSDSKAAKGDAKATIPDAADISLNESP